METKLEQREGRQIITDGKVSLPVPTGYRLIPEHTAKQGELDYDTITEMLLALHEIRDVGNDQVNAIVDRTLGMYDERQTLIENLRGIRRIGP